MDFFYRRIRCQIVPKMGYYEGRVYAPVSDADFVGHHGCDFRQPEYCGFRTNHLSDSDHRLPKGFSPDVDYVATELKKTVDRHVQSFSH